MCRHNHSHSPNQQTHKTAYDTHDMATSAKPCSIMQDDRPTESASVRYDQSAHPKSSVRLREASEANNSTVIKVSDMPASPPRP